MAGFRLFDLNPEQQKAVLSIKGPLLILAGAGTGKTRVITARTAYLIDEKVPPSSILAVTFTNKAADEMRERLRSMTDPMDAKQVTMCTFHALCVLGNGCWRQEPIRDVRRKGGRPAGVHFLHPETGNLRSNSDALQGGRLQWMQALH